MSIPDLSIKRPTFITCIFTLILVLGFISLKRLGVDLFPNVSFPIILINTVYPGTGPSEIETLVSKPIEETLGTLSGLKSISSVNREGLSQVILEFTLETDLKYAEQQVRDRMSSVKAELPDDAEEPIIRSIDPADQPVAIITVTADLPPADLYDVADLEVRPLIEQVNNVGLVEILGGRKREIQVQLDGNKLAAKEMSASQVAARLASSGMNIPAGKADTSGKEAVVRTLGEFQNLKDISDTLVNFFGNETPIRVGDVGRVVETLEDEKSRTFVGGKPALTLYVFRRSGANTMAVVDGVQERVNQINKNFQGRYKDFNINVIREMGRIIRANVQDVQESIMIGIFLTVFVVFFFLGSVRSTFITGIALPNSLLGAFFMMSIAGFTINIMTLLALSLAVGLLIDDAIVVRENIFRHMEMGEKPLVAASVGTKEVTLAVIATTLTVIAVFGPVAFLSGIVGQFFKQFGLTVCFAMAISLLDSLTMAPMLSAYFAGNLHAKGHGFFSRLSHFFLRLFDRMQSFQERVYVRILKFTMRIPVLVLLIAAVIFFASFAALQTVPKTFLPAQDNGEFQLTMDMLPGTDLDAMAKVGAAVDKRLRSYPEVEQTILTIGNRNGEPNEAQIYIKLVPFTKRTVNTSQLKEKVRQDMSKFIDEEVRWKVQDFNPVSGMGDQPFQLNISGNNFEEIEKAALAVYEKLKVHPDLKDVDISYRPGKPEFRVAVDKFRGEQRGVTTTSVGMELRTLIEGAVPAVYRKSGNEYDIRVRLQEDQRNIKENFQKFRVPNINNRMVRLADVTRAIETEGPATIYRQDRGRYIQINASINPDGQGLARPMEDVRRMFESGEVKLGPGMRYRFVGMAESFQELAFNMMVAAVLAILFIYLVLSSLYESFVTPFTIMLVLPLAACGAFYALAITRASLDIFSMIGCIMLLGVATKNSILLVDYTNQLIKNGTDMKTAIIEAGRVRLRPILMTSFALIAGMLPVAIGLNEASKQRTSMGIAVIGGLISSTFLTLVVVPAAYAYIERFRLASLRFFRRFSGSES